VTEARVRSVVSNVLGLDPSVIGDDTSPDTVEEWDSVSHMNLVLALEEEFGVKFTEDQIIEMLSYKLILHTVKESLERS
jgi:acyl carrier protein